MRTFRSRATVFMIMVLIFMLMGCGANKYRIMYGVADWEEVNHKTLQLQYDTSTPEQQAWLRVNINPYMNILQQMVIAAGAIESANDFKLSGAVAEITRISVAIKYDASRIVTAIRAKDYDALTTEALLLKTFIINKLSERK